MDSEKLEKLEALEKKLKQFSGYLMPVEMFKPLMALKSKNPGWMAENYPHIMFCLSPLFMIQFCYRWVKLNKISVFEDSIGLDHLFAEGERIDKTDSAINPKG